MGLVQTVEVLNTTANAQTYTATTDINIGSGPNRAAVIKIYAACATSGADVSITSLTLEGVPATITTSPAANGRTWCGLGALLNPASGPSTVSVTFSHAMRACIIVVEEEDSIAAIGALVSGVAPGAFGNTVTGSIDTTVAGSLVSYAAAQAGDGSDVVVTGATENYEGVVAIGSASSSDVTGVAAREVAGAPGTNDATFTFARSDRVNVAAIELIAAAGGGAQAITGNLHVNPDTSHDAAISTGAVNIDGVHNGDADVSNPGAISQGAAPAQDVAGDYAADPDQSRLGSIAPGAVGVGGDHDADSDASHAGSVAPGDVDIAGDQHIDPDVSHDGAVSQGAAPAQNIGGDHHVNTDQSHDGSITRGATPAQDVSGSHHADADTSHDGAVAPGAVGIGGGHDIDPDAGHAGSVAPGDVDIAGDPHADPDVSHDGVVSQGAAPAQDIGGAHHVNTDQSHPGAVHVGQLSKRRVAFPFQSANTGTLVAAKSGRLVRTKNSGRLLI